MRDRSTDTMNQGNLFMKRSLMALWMAGTLATAGTANVAHATVQVFGEASSSGPEIRVNVFANITEPAIVSYSFKLFYPSRDLAVVAATRNDTVWSFHDGSRTVPYPAPETGTPGEVLFIGGRMDANNPRAGVTGNRVPLGSVVFRRTSANTPDFSMSIGRSGQFASFVAVNGTVLEAQPNIVSWMTIGADPDDADLDGLADKWEESYFGSTKDAFYSDDSDRDGASNLDEEAMGSDPTDPRSLLRLELVRSKDAMVLEWPSAEGRRYTLEGAKTLGRFEVIQESIAATPPRNAVELKTGELGEMLFLRVRVDSAERR
jgi:hypothetical protein